MRKFLIAVVFLLALPMFATSPQFQLELGTGHLWSGAGSYGWSLDRADWQVHLTGAMLFTQNHGLSLSVGRDGARVLDWMNEQGYTTKTPPETAWRYTVADLGYRYTLTPDCKARLYFAIGPSGYFAGPTQKLGLFGAVGIEYHFTPHFYISARGAFRHVQQFIVPVANVAETRLAIGWRF